MSILGRRDSEPPTEEHQGQAEAHDVQAEANGPQAEVDDAQEPAAEHQAGEPAPAFWRAQGETPAWLGRDPAGAPPLAAPPAEVPPTEALPAGTPLAASSAEAPPANASAQEIPEPTVAVAREPVVTEAQESAPANQESAAAQESAPAAQESASAAATITPQRWSEILVSFVDDPRDSVKMAADAVDEAIGQFVNSVRARQRVLASSWQGTEADTEQLRTALRDYRKFWHQMQQLDLGEKTGA
jgi:hypothetical protein